MANKHGKQITGVKIQGYRRPWRYTSPDEPEVAIIVLEASESSARVQTGDDISSTTDPGWSNYGTDPIGLTPNQMLGHLFGADYTGYVHNYYFENGWAYPAITAEEDAKTNFCG